MKHQNLPKGKLGERLAEKHLKDKGYKIIERNFTKRGGELDLIAVKGKTLIFVEVKCRWSRKYGIPEDAITPRKIRLLTKTAQYYKLLHPELPEAQRLDVVAVELNSFGKLLDIRHIENITQ